VYVRDARLQVVREAINMVSSLSCDPISVVVDVWVRIKKLPLALPSTAEPMLDARHSHSSHTHDLEYVYAYAQAIEQTL
jgi:hypothetical protein